jgi:hypothetical protein
MALIRLLSTFANDVRFAIRQISRTPLLSGVVSCPTIVADRAAFSRIRTHGEIS